MIEFLIIYLIGYILSTFIITNLFSRLINLDNRYEKTYYEFYGSDDIVFAYLISVVWFVTVPALLFILFLCHFVLFIYKLIPNNMSTAKLRDLYLKAAKFRFLSKDQ